MYMARSERNEPGSCPALFVLALPGILGALSR